MKIFKHNKPTTPKDEHNNAWIRVGQYLHKKYPDIFSTGYDVFKNKLCAILKIRSRSLTFNEINNVIDDAIKVLDVKKYTFNNIIGKQYTSTAVYYMYPNL